MLLLLSAPGSDATHLGQPPPEIVEVYERAEILVFGHKGALISPDTAVTHSHWMGETQRQLDESVRLYRTRVQPTVGFGILARQYAERSASGSRVIFPEYTRRAELVCTSPFTKYDYAIWRILEPIPQEAKPIPVSHDLRQVAWVVPHRGYLADRVFKSDPGSADFPVVEVPGHQPISGWSGSMVLTGDGKLAGLVALVGHPGDEAVGITIPRWWTCDGVRR